MCQTVQLGKAVAVTQLADSEMPPARVAAGQTSSPSIVTKSVPLRTSRVCLHCGLQSGVTSHGNVRECVDALQREVTRLEISCVKANGVFRSLRDARRIRTVHVRRRLRLPPSEPRDVHLC